MLNINQANQTAIGRMMNARPIMKPFRRLIFLCLLLAGCGADDFTDDSPLARVENAVESGSQIAAFDKFVAQTVREDGIVGAAVAIVSSDEIWFAEGYGMRDLEADLPASANTLFHIGSTNKSLTALLIATMVDDELLSWDTTAATIYPQFALSDPASTDTVTMRHLLSMRSGIPDWIEDDFDIDNTTGDDVIPFVASTELDGEPGDYFSYSNISSSIGGYLGVIAATDSAENVYDGYASLLTERVLQPIGMTNSVVNVSDALDDRNYGKSYVLEGGDPVEADPEDYDGDPLAPSGTVKSSATEMGMYIQTHLNEGVAPNGTRVVSAENITETWKPYLENYGMGWEAAMIDGVEVIMHEGSYDNYLSIIGFIPELDIGFVVLANTADAADNLITNTPSTVVELFAE